MHGSLRLNCVVWNKGVVSALDHSLGEVVHDWLRLSMQVSKHFSECHWPIRQMVSWSTLAHKSAMAPAAQSEQALMSWLAMPCVVLKK
jgi:hypothetical protein